MINLSNVQFILVDSSIYSLHTNTPHYIPSYKLIDLYNLPINQCILTNEINDSPKNDVNPFQITLYPRPYGDYSSHLIDKINEWLKICEL